MAIQWYPGHMHKARKEMAQVLPQTDVILEVLDARLPYSSENPMLESLRGNKPCLKVLTKYDLADPAITDTWLDSLQCDTVRATTSSSTDSDSIKALPALFKSMVKHSESRIKPYVVMVVGIPNVGKSTLINLLAGKVVAKTGNEPAITKRQQHINLQDNWMLRDTPGVLWPNVDNPDSGYRLASTGAIRDTAMDSSDVAAHLLDYLCVNYAESLQERFDTDLPLADSIGTLEAIGKSRGCLGGGGLVDFDRAARLLLTEFRAGKLGRITLETPAMKLTEVAAVEEQRIVKEQEKTRKKQARKTARNKRQR